MQAPFYFPPLSSNARNANHQQSVGREMLPTTGSKLIGQVKSIPVSSNARRSLLVPREAEDGGGLLKLAQQRIARSSILCIMLYNLSATLL
jgi:hypothetical protein